VSTKNQQLTLTVMECDNIEQGECPCGFCNGRRTVSSTPYRLIVATEGGHLFSASAARSKRATLYLPLARSLAPHPGPS
jgi:hypothetical protein